MMDIQKHLVLRSAMCYQSTILLSSYTLVYAIDYIEDLMFGDFYKNIMMYYYDRPKNSRSMTLNAWVSKLKKLRYDMYLDDMKKYHTLSNRSK